MMKLPLFFVFCLASRAAGQNGMDMPIGNNTEAENDIMNSTESTISVVFDMSDTVKVAF